MQIYLDKNKINIKVKTLSTLGKFWGLMFKSKDSQNLLFKFSKPARYSIHSFFVSFPFLAVWLNKKNKVLDFKIVHPYNFSIKPKVPFTNLIEIPINRNNQKIIQFFVDKGKV